MHDSLDDSIHDSMHDSLDAFIYMTVPILLPMQALTAPTYLSPSSPDDNSTEAAASAIWPSSQSAQGSGRRSRSVQSGSNQVCMCVCPCVRACVCA